ncbi:MAG: hypothetical protein DRR03_01275 [Gammaproteobacteria bacterium]|nr:MAG: hypothetical protein DRR03_01275 [Gammaproteobacteria bacterium]
MHIQARRVFRLSLTVALSLALGYVLPMALPFLAPVFAVILCATPGPPMRLKALIGLTLLVAISPSIGVLLIPLLLQYPVSALMIITVGLFFSAYLTVNLGKGLVGMFLTVGIALISAAGTVSDQLATTVIKDLLFGIGLAIICQWVVYPWFPEDAVAKVPPKTKATGAEQSSWIAMRSTLIVLPAYLLALTNPTMYLAIIMKSVSLSQQSSVVDARSAGRELVGSTFLAGVFSVLFWMLLSILPNLWMFFWLMLSCMVFVAARIYGVVPSRYPASFWINVVVTMLILLGPAVQDSANGKDVMSAFAVRLGLFIAVTLYAWLAVYLLERWRKRRDHYVSHGARAMEV